MANGQGGKRPGAGRPKSREVYKPEPGELTPLAYMLSIVRGQQFPTSVRMDAAHKAAPYCHARVAQAIDLEGEVVIQLVSYLDDSQDP